jgi:hypothetical protein
VKAFIGRIILQENDTSHKNSNLKPNSRETLSEGIRYYGSKEHFWASRRRVHKTAQREAL